MSEPDTKGDSCGGGEIGTAQVQGLQLIDIDWEGVSNYSMDASDTRKRMKLKLSPLPH